MYRGAKIVRTCREVWFDPTLAPYPTFPRPNGQIVAMSSDWWWKPTNGPTKQCRHSPAPTPLSGPSTE